jgi:TRAP-type C4-dicarboxylate transport system substrate-binding protein
VIPIKKPLIAMIAGVSTAVVLTACGQGDDDAAQDAQSGGGSESIEPVDLIFADIQPDAATSGGFRTRWMERVTELTDGNVTFTFQGSGTLHPGPEAISAIQSGLTNVDFFSNGYWPDQLPVSFWQDTVFQQATFGLGYPVAQIAGGAALAAVYDQGTASTEEMASAGFVPMLPMYSSPSVLTCAEPFATPADLAGRTVRVSNAVNKAEAEALGMAGQFLDPTEQFEGLQRGIIDCAINAATTVPAAGLFEVSPYTAVWDQPSGLAYYGISKDTWDSLPDAAKEAMEQARNEELVAFIKDTLDGYADFATAADEAGGEIIDPVPVNEALSEFRASQPDIASSAPSGVSDPEAEVDAVQGVVEEWVTFVENDLGVAPGTAESAEELQEALRAGSGLLDDSGWDAYLEHLNESTGSS